MELPIPLGTRWSRVPITCVEDVQQAVLGAGFDALQLSRGPMRGSLAFTTHDQMTFSSGHLDGRVCLAGPMSTTMTALGLGVYMAPGSRHWMKEVHTGGVGIFRPGDPHEAIYLPGTVYACVTVHDDRLEEVAADMDLVLDARQLGGSRISRRTIAQSTVAVLQREFAHVHATGERGLRNARLCRLVLECLIQHVAREPRQVRAPRDPNGHRRIVSRARAYILENLDTPLSIAAIAHAAFASQSTLYRAFHEVFDDTPQAFVRKLRLNRIRRDIATEPEARCTIALLANRWGVAELGRFAGWYRQLFGELPSQTRERRLSMVQNVLQSRRLTRTA